MRVLIQADEGELADKLEPLIEKLRSEAHDHLCKATADDQQPRKLDARALQESIDLAGPVVERIRQAMVRRMEETLKGSI
ncbi:MAG: hypothetical protein MUC88_00120 [Planctomycetes bacterium]|jgi:hypothetical protein|nr:hypothetical protein [Planctomycetota bacterium]